MRCPVCGGRGWVQMAPVETVAVWRGTNPTPVHESKAAWHQSAQVPCFACYPHNIAVLA